MKNNRLLCVFSSLEDLESNIEYIRNSYTILSDQICVLEKVAGTELIIFANIESGNVGTIPKNSIFVHRESSNSVLYTIDALNYLNKLDNGGTMVYNYKPNWSNFKNSFIKIIKGNFIKEDIKFYKFFKV